MMLLPASVGVVGSFEQGFRVLRAPEVTLREGFEVVAAFPYRFEAIVHGSASGDSGSNSSAIRARSSS